MASMAILASLFALGSRFASKILTTTLGWASTLLFGRVPADRQILLLGITFGSVIWLVLVGGVVVPDVGAFLLLLVPRQEIIPETTLRIAMLGAALTLPAAVGGLTLALGSPADRTPREVAAAVARGYPLTIVLAVLLIFLAGLAVWRKAHSVRRRWTDAHVPIVVGAGAYEQVADDLDRAVTAAGLHVTPSPAPSSMSTPARLLAAVAGRRAATLIPDQMIQLVGPDLSILIYPMDLLISGKPELVNRARAAMASRLTTTEAHLTVSAEAQAVEDRLTTMMTVADDTTEGPRRFDEAAATELAAIDEVLATIPVPYEEWEVLYRQRLQVERELRVRAMDAAHVVDTGAAVEHGAAGATLATIGQWVRAGADAVADAAIDERTGQFIDRMAGPVWRWAARIASVAAGAARAALTAPCARDPDDAITGVRDSGEPARYPAAERPSD
jgi:hypothetical protein